MSFLGIDDFKKFCQLLKGDLDKKANKETLVFSGASSAVSIALPLKHMGTGGLLGGGWGTGKTEGISDLLKIKVEYAYWYASGGGSRVPLFGGVAEIAVVRAGGYGYGGHASVAFPEPKGTYSGAPFNTIFVCNYYVPSDPGTLLIDASTSAASSTSYEVVICRVFVEEVTKNE